MRLIDADVLILDIDDCYHNSPFYHPGTPWHMGLELAAGLLLKAPTIDAVEVVHGRWIFGNTLGYAWMKCSKCLKSQMPNGCFTYCPNCGAKMDGEDNG